MFFTFVGTFAYVIYRLEEPPFSYSVALSSLVFLLWVARLTGPLAGRMAERFGWRRLALGAVVLSAAGVLSSRSSSPPRVSRLREPEPATNLVLNQHKGSKALTR